MGRLAVSRANPEPTMADLRRPSRLALALVAVVLPAVMGWACRALVDATDAPAANGVSVELPAAPSAASLHTNTHADDA